MDSPEQVTVSNEKSNIYTSSIFDLGISPEYCNGEVSLASLYRNIGWQIKLEGSTKRFSEQSVNQYSHDFFSKFKLTNKKIDDENWKIKFNEWSVLLNKSLASPYSSNQVNSKYPVLYPFVPDCTLYSGAARLKGNPWNPGKLIERIICLGAIRKEEVNFVWEQLFEKLSCNPEDINEDILARIITSQFELLRGKEIIWKLNPISIESAQIDEEFIESSPVKQFVIDLKKVLELKQKLTRRQWLSSLESLIRIGTGSYILWLCNINYQLSLYFKDCLNGQRALNGQELRQFLFSDNSSLLELEEKASSINQIIQNYIKGYTSINYILKKLELEASDGSINSIDGILKIGSSIQKKVKNKDWQGANILSEIQDLNEKDPGLFACKSGRTKNIFEFLRHSMGQKQTADPYKKAYDQSFWLRKKGQYQSAPWIVDMGPASILTLVYCCCYGFDQNRTINDLLEHLKRYGIEISPNKLLVSNFLATLTTLQVVSDSPDAEGGMVIINPFN